MSIANFVITTPDRGQHKFWTKAAALRAWESFSRAPLFTGQLLQGRFQTTENTISARGQVFVLASIESED